MIDNEIKMMRQENLRLGHEREQMVDKIADNTTKIKQNKVLPYLVSKVVEVSSGVGWGLDGGREEGAVVLFLPFTRLTLLPVPVTSVLLITALLLCQSFSLVILPLHPAALPMTYRTLFTLREPQSKITSYPNITSCTPQTDRIAPPSSFRELC